MALEAVGSNPITHPIFSSQCAAESGALSPSKEQSHILGRSQAARQRTLTPPSLVRVQPSLPLYGSLAQLAEHLPFKQGVRGSNPR